MREARIPKPTSPDFIRSASRRAVLMPIGAGADMVSPPQGTDSWVEEAVDEIEDEDGDNEQIRVDCGERDDEGRVEDDDCGEEELAYAVVAEHGLRDDRALPRGNQGEGEGGDDWGGRGAQDILAQDRPFRQALRPRRGHEVLVHDLQHEVPGRV